MVRAGEITPAQARSASAQPITLRKPSTADDVKAPGFVHWVAAQLEKTYGEELLKNGGVSVINPPDLDLHAVAEGQAGEKAMALQGEHVTCGALARLDPATSAVPGVGAARGGE